MAAVEERGSYVVRRFSLVLALACVVVSLVGAGTATAGVEYSKPVTYSDGGYPAIAPGPGGDVRFAWEGLFPDSDYEGGIVTAELSDSGNFHDPAPVAANVPLFPGPERSVWGPQVATDTAGLTCIAFSLAEYSGVSGQPRFDAGLVTVAPGGTVGPEVDLGENGVNYRRLETTSDGGFVVLWTTLPSGDLRSAAIAPDGEVGESKTLVEAEGEEVLVPLGLAAVGGDDRVVWTDRESRRVGSMPLDGHAPRTDVLSPHSFAHGPLPVVSGSRIYAFRRKAGGAYGLFSVRADGARRPTTFFDTRPAGYPTSLRVVGDDSGHTVGVWDAADEEVRAAALDPTAQARPRTLTPGLARGEGSRAAIDGEGRATVVWRKIRRDGYVFEGVATRLDRHGRPGAVTNFSRNTGIVQQLSVVVDSHDRAVISWNHYGGDTNGNAYVRAIADP